MSVSVRPQRSSRRYQSALLRARRDTSSPSTIPTCPSATSAVRRAKPLRSTIPAPDRPRSSSITTICCTGQPSVDALAHATLGHELVLVGRPLEAIPRIERAVCLSPRDPRQGIWMSMAGLAYLTARKYEDAALWSARATQRHRENPDAQIILASSLGHLGRSEEARIALDTYKRLLPNAPATLVWPHKHE